MRVFQVALIAITTWATIAHADEPTADEMASEVPRVEESAALRGSLAAAEKVVVMEGLPTPYSPHYEAEEKRDDTEFRIVDYYPAHVYKPADTAPDASADVALKELLSAPGILQAYDERRYCGGYYPDYIVVWRTGEKGGTMGIFLDCEAVKIDDESMSKAYTYTLTPEKIAAVKAVLAKYDSKRPKEGPEYAALRAKYIADEIRHYPPLATSAAMREALQAADTFDIHEGLPHPGWEGDSYRAERQRLKPDELRVIDREAFYAPATTVRDHKALRDLLVSDATYRVYGGPKMCGSFHADYAATWRVKDVDYYALICFGCHEIVISDGTAKTFHDLSDDNVESLQKELATYDKHRPRVQRRVADEENNADDPE